MLFNGNVCDTHIFDYNPAIESKLQILEATKHHKRCTYTPDELLLICANDMLYNRLTFYGYNNEFKVNLLKKLKQMDCGMDIMGLIDLAEELFITINTIFTMNSVVQCMSIRDNIVLVNEYRNN